MSSLSRSRSLKTQRKTVLQKKRPSTWTCHTKRLSTRHTISPRVSKWCQRMSTKSINDATFQFFHQRQTTISTLTTHSEAVTPFLAPQNNNIFHVQSILFLFGFLWFPCWWVAAYWFKIEPDRLNREEKQVVMIHPSLLANGKTCSKSFWVSPVQEKFGTVELFYRWNKVMSLVSVGLVVCIVCLVIWYYVGYH
ncbi:hypothetical protein BDF21DRAFT_430369 [Thamnidium elegans]|uniref:Uncharacterized protein n=1 Tax=Thamnidium elegans TaxID=101142 RepID=A0A8H7SJ08_9FUNG|nr:hypothetical protein INT48_009588 [Thamnidium elegans]KAI8057428.1 hypothetical protein BDF21DRAFT_430369 [Thamnidium elegans]